MYAEAGGQQMQFMLLGGSAVSLHPPDVYNSLELGLSKTGETNGKVKPFQERDCCFSNILGCST